VPKSSLDHSDPTVRMLARLFREHPAWRHAAAHIREGSTSRVFFRHRPGEPWHLERREGETRLEPGDADDPDFAFRFTPRAVERLSAVEGGVGRFAVALFELILAEDDELRVGFRVVAPLRRLVWRGYLRLLLAAGPEVAAFGARHGVGGLSDLRRVVAQARRQAPAPWERQG